MNSKQRLQMFHVTVSTTEICWVLLVPACTGHITNEDKICHHFYSMHDSCFLIYITQLRYADIIVITFSHLQIHEVPFHS